MTAEVVDFKAAQIHRQAFGAGAEFGVEFDCGICGAHVCAYAKTDPYPSCLECRAWCNVWACQ